MAKIVALRGVGDDQAQAPVVSPSRMPAATALLWLASLATAGYIFWATAFKPPRRRARKRVA